MFGGYEIQNEYTPKSVLHYIVVKYTFFNRYINSKKLQIQNKLSYNIRKKMIKRELWKIPFNN